MHYSLTIDIIRILMKLLLVIIFGAVVTAAQYAEARSQVLLDFEVGNQQFSAGVYREVAKHAPGNFLVCPLSVTFVLALAQTGARGRTAQQLSAALHLPENPEIVKQTFRELIPFFQDSDKYELSTANKIYVKKGVQINNAYKSNATGIFRADIENIDFSKKRQAAAEINRWVAEKTHNKIKEIISPSVLSYRTRAMLINTMYFKGKWVYQFDKFSTRKRPFFLNKYHTVDVDMMETTTQFNYHEDYNLNAKFLEMFYEGHDISMTFVLPNDEEGLGTLEGRIEDVLINRQYSWEDVHVQIPKFKIETTIKMKIILQQLGIVDAFEDYANFDGMVDNEESLKIGQVLQKTFIEVDEEGTTAGTMTYVPYDQGSVAALPSPKQFIADHPFIYYLKSSVAGVMFVGRYIQQL